MGLGPEAAIYSSLKVQPGRTFDFETWSRAGRAALDELRFCMPEALIHAVKTRQLKKDRITVVGRF